MKKIITTAVTAVTIATGAFGAQKIKKNTQKIKELQDFKKGMTIYIEEYKKSDFCKPPLSIGDILKGKKPETLQEIEQFIDEVGEVIESKNPKSNQKLVKSAVEVIDQFLNDYDEYLVFQDNLIYEIARLVIQSKTQKLIKNWKLKEAIEQIEQMQEQL